MSQKNKRSPITAIVLKACIGVIIFVIAVYIVLVGVLLYSIKYPSGLPPVLFASIGQKEEAEDTPEDIFDLSSWTSEELAAQMLIIMSPSNDPVGLYILAQRGVGGVVLSSDAPVPEIVDAIAGSQTEVPRGIKMFIASDEEGGQIRRLQGLLGSFPGALEMGTWESEEITRAVHDYGRELEKIGVNVALAPVADLLVKGSYMTEYDRAFSDDPEKVAEYVVAWQQGMHAAGLAVVPKHWPGMGSADDTHVAATVIPPLAELERRDMIPFRAALGDGADMIMVGHAVSAGLTEPNTPATISPGALKYLREQAGDEVIIVTDAMHMPASTKSLKISFEEAVLKSAAAGADLIMSMMYQGDMVSVLAEAIEDGRVPRAQAEESVRRILALKEKMGLLS